MRIIPVIDLYRGQVVHAVAGERASYQPIQSTLTSDTSPGNLAKTFVERFRCAELYVADLDAILNGSPQFELWRSIAESGARLWIDAGLQNVHHVRELQGDVTDFRTNDVTWIVGLESIAGPEELAPLLNELTVSRCAFSLDMRASTLMTKTCQWPSSPLELANLVALSGFTRLIVLDLADVGRSQGVGTLSLCRLLHERHPNIELIAGGGVRNAEDLRRMEEAGCAGALVATALHRGMI